MAFVPYPGASPVATAMTPVVQRAVYDDPVMIDEVTYTSRYRVGNAGQIQVVAYSPDNSIEATSPGSDFDDKETSYDILDININNAFQKSTKLPAYTEAAMTPDMKVEEASNTAEDVRVGRQKAALAVLIDSAMPTDNPTKVSPENAKAMLLADYALIRKLNGRPDVVLCSVDTFSAVLEAAGKDFDGDARNLINREGRVGRWLGMWFIECTSISKDEALKYRDADGTTQEVSTAGVDYIMYDHSAFSIIDILAMFRIIDNPNAAGVKVQMEVDTGFKVTNKDCVLVHTTDGAAGASVQSASLIDDDEV